jgi:GNAT superfamily N-acetyltransferase
LRIFEVRMPSLAGYDRVVEPSAAINLLPPDTLASCIADTAENLEIRGMLHSGACIRGSDPSRLVVWKRGGSLVVIAGAPDIRAVRLALESSLPHATVMLRRSAWTHWKPFFANWKVRRALRSVQPEAGLALDLSRPGGVWFSAVEHARMLDQLPLSFREELLEGHSTGDVALSLEGESIAAYCFPSWVTPKHFDVNVVTLPEFRRRGHGRTCCSRLLSKFSTTGERAQWFTACANRPSMALCRRLGFQPFESMLLLRRQPKFGVT